MIANLCLQKSNHMHGGLLQLSLFR